MLKDLSSVISVEIILELFMFLKLLTGYIFTNSFIAVFVRISMSLLDIDCFHLIYTYINET